MAPPSGSMKDIFKTIIEEAVGNQDRKENDGDARAKVVIRDITGGSVTIGDNVTININVTALHEHGRATCRESVCQYEENSEVAGSLKKKENKIKKRKEI